MSRNVIRPADLTEGAEWVFVHSSGDRTTYTYASRICPANPPVGDKLGLDAMHKLLNPATGGHAQVSEKWMGEGPVASAVSPTGLGSHWLLPALAERA